MAEALRLLIVEDSEDDALLLVRELTQGGYEPAWKRVDTAEAMRAALASGEWEAVLCDYVMPRFGGLEALGVLRKSGLDLPFILVSGKIGEETAVDAMLAGAGDYVMKSDLRRLVPALRRELAGARTRRQHRRDLEETRRLAAIVTSTDDAIIGTTLDGIVVDWNRSAESIYGFKAGEIVGRSVAVTIPPEYRDELPRVLDAIRRGEGIIRHETVRMRKDGTRFPVSLTVSPIRDDTGAVVGISAIARDVTERKRAEEALRCQEEYFRSLIEQSSDVVAVINQGARYSYISPAMERVLGYGPQELIGLPAFGFTHTDDIEQARKILQSAFGQPGSLHRTELRVRHKDGSWRVLEAVGRAARNQEGALVAIVNARDITERKRYEAEIERLANQDALTGLPNRTRLGDRLGQAMAYARREGHQIALLFLDLDGFKFVNDSFGHAFGDALLSAVANRLSAAMRDGDTVARLGGDEFVLLLPDVKRVEGVSTVAVKLLESFTQPFDVEGREVFVTASIGISLFPQDGEDMDTLLKNADAAMYRAKERGKNEFQFYMREMSAAAMERLSLENELRHSLEQGAFEVYYQPQVEFATRHITGMEALVRWHHPELGIVSPARFIPVAEDSGLIVPIGEWVIRSACGQAQRWERAGYRGLVLSVNLSARQFWQGDVVRMVEGVLRDTGIDPSRLELEVTESVVLRDLEETVRALSELRALGVSVAIDDFGTGYSSLGYLRRLPIDRLKIERSFIRDVVGDPAAATLVRAIVDMAHALGLEVVAEGVETEAQWEALAAMRCKTMQGYYFSPPVPAEQFERLLGGAAGNRPVPSRRTGG